MKTLMIDENEKSAIVRAEQGRKTVTVLAREISSAYAEFQRGAEEVIELALSLENRRIKLGTLLSTAKEQLGHGRFGEFIEKNCLFSERSAQRFMRHAEAAGGRELESLDDVREYNKLLVAWGLREPEQGHGPQALHDAPNFFVRTTKALGTTRKSLDELLESRPLDQWNDSEREQLKSQLQPVVDVFNQL